MKTKRKLIYTFIAIVILCAGTAICQARVFLRWGSSADNADHIFTTLGGTMAYETELNINGGKGHLTIFHFKQNIHHVVDMLSEIFGIDNFNYSDGTLCTASVISEESSLKLVIISLQNDRETIMFRFKQTNPETITSATTPTTHLMKNLPPFPGSKPLFFAENKDTDMSMAVSESHANPAEISEFFNTHMSTAGWKKALPHPGTQNLYAKMTVYCKSHEISCILACPSNEKGLTQIVMLYKKQIMN